MVPGRLPGGWPQETPNFLFCKCGGGQVRLRRLSELALLSRGASPAFAWGFRAHAQVEP